VFGIVPAICFVLHQGLGTAFQAQPIVAANDPAALGAAPFFPLLFQEGIHSLALDVLQVFNHAHVVFAAIPLVKGFQPRAGKRSAFKAKPHFPIFKQLAPVPHVKAMLSPFDAARTVSPVKPIFVKVKFLELIGDAQTAIHPTGGDACLFHVRSSSKQDFAWVLDRLAYSACQSDNITIIPFEQFVQKQIERDGFLVRKRDALP
jgi:hypothetical protein